MQECPHCNEEIQIRELPHPGLFANFRVCRKCGGSFTVDPDSKRRQVLFIVVLLVSLVFSVFLYFGGTDWLIPALASYIVLTALLYCGNKKLFLVPYDEGEKPG